MPPEPFPAPEPVRPVFCCAKVTPKDPNYASAPGPIESSLQRSRLSKFVTNISAYSLSNGIPVTGATWSESAGCLIQVLPYRKKEIRKTKTKMKKDKWTWRKGMGRKKEEKWVQAELGRFFVETGHEMGKRWPDHAFEEVLITEEGIPGVCRRVEEVGLVVGCERHRSVRYVCEFWGKA